MRDSALEDVRTRDMCADDCYLGGRYDKRVSLRVGGSKTGLMPYPLSQRRLAAYFIWDLLILTSPGLAFFTLGGEPARYGIAACFASEFGVCTQVSGFNADKEWGVA